MTGQEARDDELIAELRGFAEGSTSARASLMRDAADAIERLRKHPEPEPARDDEREALAQFIVARLADNGYPVPETEVRLALLNWDALMSPLRKHPEPEITESQRALIEAADAMTADEVHDHPFAALDKVRGLTRELRAALRVPVGEGNERG